MTLPNNGKDRFLAIDANAIVHRAFHAYLSNLQTEDGIQELDYLEDILSLEISF